MKTLLPLGLVLLLTGCIVVKQFGTYWDKGYEDPCVQQIVEATILEGNPQGTPIKLLSHSLRVGAYRFLMLRDKPGDKGGNLYRYAVQNGDYIAYRLNENMRDNFQREYPHAKAVTLTQETVTIDALNDQTYALLETIAARPEYWIETDRRPYNPGQRRDCTESKP